MQKKSWETAISPYMDKKISYDVAIEKGIQPFKEFMLKNTRESDLALFYRIKKRKILKILKMSQLQF